ncbi:MAG: sensor histidine kinase [Actinomycetota bacterium]
MEFTEPRVAALIDAGISLAAEHRIEALLQRIADLARHVIGAHYAAVGVLGRGGELKEFVHSGMEPDALDRIGHLPEGVGLLGAIIEEGEPLRLQEISSHPRSSGFPANHPVMHTFLGVPIVVRGTIFGRLYLTDKEGEAAFSKDDERVALMLAGQAGVALENARLYDELRGRNTELARRLAELSSVALLGDLLVSGQSLDEMIDSALEQARALTGAERALLLILDETTHDLVIRNATGDDFAAGLPGSRLPSGGAKAFQVWRRQKAEIVEDYSRDAEEDVRTYWMLGSPRNAALAPLMARGRCLGVMSVHNRSGDDTFGRDDLTIMQMLANQVAAALENERLRDRVRDMALLEERERISKELHDGVIQSIYSVGLSLQGTMSMLDSDPGLARKRVDAAISHLDEVVTDVRSYIFELRPRTVERRGLPQTFRELVRELQTNTRAEVDAQIDEEALAWVREEKQADLIQILREIMSNIARHAGASLVEVEAAKSDRGVLIRISDNGIGYDPDDVRRGQGLNNIEKRAASLGAEFTVNPRQPRGTVHEVLIRMDGRGHA